MPHSNQILGERQGRPLAVRPAVQGRLDLVQRPLGAFSFVEPTAQLLQPLAVAILADVDGESPLVCPSSGWYPS